MAEKNDGGDKTELPTPKRLRDARKKGDVAKSKDVGSGLVILGWFVLIALAASYAGGQVAVFFSDTLNAATEMPFDQALRSVGWQGTLLLIKLSLLVLAPIAIFATLAEYMQIGPVMTTEKMKPSFDKLNPVEGLKRMFGMDGLVEMAKTLVKVVFMVVIVYFMIRTGYSEAGQFINLAGTSPLHGSGQQIAAQAMGMTYSLTLQFFAMVVGVFLLVGLADHFYSRHRFIKKMKMSMRDIRQEHKDDEGDPHIKAHRREMHQEWANQNAIGASGGAAALLVNPTHLAIALDYDEEDCPVPVIAAKGEGALAEAMREEAKRNDVPIIRNIATARRLWARGEIGEIVPEDMFDAIAEIILWARKARAGDAPMWQEMDVDSDGNEPVISARLVH
ncbi:MAG: EscU/YscU/HrcU family type III secretion system export apparatus switch protein [Sphingorhabdus sp.]